MVLWVLIQVLDILSSQLQSTPVLGNQGLQLFTVGHMIRPQRTHNTCEIQWERYYQVPVRSEESQKDYTISDSRIAPEKLI